MHENSFHDSVASFAETMRRQTAILDDLTEAQRGMRLLHAYALSLLGLALLGLGFLVWQHRFSDVRQQALLENSRAIAAQVQLLREQLQQR